MALTLKKTEFDSLKGGRKTMIYVSSDSNDVKEYKNQTYQSKDIFSRYNAKYDRVKNTWYWVVDNPKMADKYAKIAAAAVNRANKFVGAKAQNLLNIINALDDIEDAAVTKIGNVTKGEKSVIEHKIREFIDNLHKENDVEKFQNKINDFLKFVSNRRNYSFRNCLLIYLQNPKASDVRSASEWKRLGRKVSLNAKKIILVRPPLRSRNEQEKKEAEQEYRKIYGFQSN